jgi:hypothetical protein
VSFLSSSSRDAFPARVRPCLLANNVALPSLVHHWPSSPLLSAPASCCSGALQPRPRDHSPLSITPRCYSRPFLPHTIRPPLMVFMHLQSGAPLLSPRGYKSHGRARLFPHPGCSFSRTHLYHVATVFLPAAITAAAINGISAAIKSSTANHAPSPIKCDAEPLLPRMLSLSLRAFLPCPLSSVRITKSQPTSPVRTIAVVEFSARAAARHALAPRPASPPARNIADHRHHVVVVARRSSTCLAVPRSAQAAATSLSLTTPWSPPTQSCSSTLCTNSASRPSIPLRPKPQLFVLRRT